MNRWIFIALSFCGLASSASAQIPPEKAMATFKVAEGLAARAVRRRADARQPDLHRRRSQGPRLGVRSGQLSADELRPADPSHPKATASSSSKTRMATARPTSRSSSIRARRSMARSASRVAPVSRRQGPESLRLPVARHPRLRGQGRRPEGRRPAQEIPHRLRRLRSRSRRSRHQHRPGRQALFHRRRHGREEPAKLRRQGPEVDQQQHRLPGRHRLALRHGRHEPRTDRPQLPQQLRMPASTASAKSGSPTTTTTATSRRASATSCPAATTAITRAARAKAHWHEEQPGIVHKILRTGFGSPTGICFYEGTLLPEEVSAASCCTATPARAKFRCFHIKPKGAGYELEKELLVTSTDNWFRLSRRLRGPGRQRLPGRLVRSRRRRPRHGRLDARPHLSADAEGAQGI